MQCPRCGSENPPAALSCLSCGQLLAVAGAAGGAVSAIPSPAEFGLGRHQAARAGQYGTAADENTSGWGAGYPLPAEVPGWSFAGLAPFGLFALYNGLHAWGIAGMLLNALCWPLYIVYVLYMGFEGRALAWRQRRFASLAEFERTMRIWSYAGLAAGVLGVALTLLWTWFFFSTLAAFPGACYSAPASST